MGNEVLRVSGLDKDIILAPPKLTVSISGETSTQAGQIEWYTVSGATVGQTGQIKPTSSQGKENSSRFRSSESRHPPVDMYHNHQQEPLAAGKCVSKHLYINDADEKRKRVECLARLQLANGLQLGTLASKAIKVISKPSKKRQSVKNMERKVIVYLIFIYKCHFNPHIKCVFIMERLSPCLIVFVLKLCLRNT